MKTAGHAILSSVGKECMTKSLTLWAPLVTHIQFLPTLTLPDQTDVSWELMKWSPKIKIMLWCWNKILSSSPVRNVWRTVWRRCMLMFGLKELERPHGRLHVLGKIVNGTLSDNWLLLPCKRGYSYSFTSALEKCFCYRCMYSVFFLLYSQHVLLFYDCCIKCYFLPCSSSVA